MKERNYGIDLLRLLLMFMVCILHVLNQGGVLWVFPAGSPGHRICWLLEIICYCAVDCFALISGYTASGKPRKLHRLVTMWFQVFFYSFLLTGILWLLGPGRSLGPGALLEAAFPVTSGYFWYFTAYFALFFAMPLLDRFLLALDRTAARKGLILLVLLYSVLECLTGAFSCQKGYTPIWLMVLYAMGLLARQGQVFEKTATPVLLFLWAGANLAAWAAFVFLDTAKLIDYVSPTVLFSALMLVILFSRLPVKGRIISRLSPLAFGIYLFQMNHVVMDGFIQNRFAFLGQKNPAAAVGGVLAAALGVFLVGLAVEWVRSSLAKRLGISRLSEGIAAVLDNALTRLTVLLN